MVIAGAARSVIVKLAYQRGFAVPLTVTMLYLSGQSLSIIVYWIQKKTCFVNNPIRKEQGSSTDEITDHLEEQNSDHTGVRWHDHNEDVENQEDINRVQNPMIGSRHGLTAHSERAIQWIHLIPYYAKPIIPSFFNLLNSFLRWASLIYIAASVAEMLISGLELTLSVLAARVFRKRLISRERWIGVLFVTIGIITIGYVDYRYTNSEWTNEEDFETFESVDNLPNRTVIGISLVVARSIVAVFQDLSEELFMQASDFPPTLLLGFEGIFGLIFGFFLFFFYGENFGEDFPSEITTILKQSPQKSAWVVGLPFLFLVTGIFNIKSTEVTSSMTRNVWKNLRSLLVWVLSLIIFYASGNSAIGEEWRVPKSLYTLLGFFIMTVGIIVYYSQKQKEETTCTKEQVIQNVSHHGGLEN